MCHNTIGSFGCACKEGYIEDGEDKCKGNTSRSLNWNTQIFRSHVSFTSISSVQKYLSIWGINEVHLPNVLHLYFFLKVQTRYTSNVLFSWEVHIKYTWSILKEYLISTRDDIHFMGSIFIFKTRSILKPFSLSFKINFQIKRLRTSPSFKTEARVNSKMAY